MLLFLFVFLMTAGVVTVMLWAVMAMFTAGRVLAAGAMMMRRLWMSTDVHQQVALIKFIRPRRVCIGRYLLFLVLVVVTIVGKHRMFSAVFDSQRRISFCTSQTSVDAADVELPQKSNKVPIKSRETRVICSGAILNGLNCISCKCWAYGTQGQCTADSKMSNQ